MKRTPLNKVGKRGKRMAAGDAQFRKAVRENANGLCEKCGRQGQHSHHVVYRDSGLLRNDPRNGCYLCFECHALAHSERTAFDTWFAMHRPSDYNFIDENRFRSTKEVA